MRSIKIKCKTVNKNGEIEFGFRDVDVFDSMYEYASHYRYVQAPDTVSKDLPSKYRVFPLEYRPSTDHRFSIFNQEFDIVIDGVTYSLVDSSEANIPNPENHFISYIPEGEVFKHLYTLCCCIRDKLGYLLASNGKVYRSLEDAEKDLPKFDAELNDSLVDNFLEVEKHLEEEEKRREDQKKRWGEEIKGLYYFVNTRTINGTSLVGVGKTEVEALFDAKGKIGPELKDKFVSLASRYLGNEDLIKLSEEFQTQYNLNGDTEVKKEPIWVALEPAYISHKAYNALKELGYNTELELDERNEMTTITVYRLPEEFETDVNGRISVISS